MRKIVVWFALLSVGCSSSIGSSQVAEDSVKKTPVQKYTPNPDRQAMVRPLDNDYRDTIYSSVLSEIFWNDSQSEKFTEINPSDRVIYQIEPVKPADDSMIDELPDISSSLAKSFRDHNLSPEKLNAESAVLGPVHGVKGNRDLVVFYRDLKKKYNDLKAVVAMSDIGVDDTNTKALVYLEFYAPAKGLVRYYFVCSLEKYVPDTEADRITGVPDIAVFPAN